MELHTKGTHSLLERVLLRQQTSKTADTQSRPTHRGNCKAFRALIDQLLKITTVLSVMRISRPT